MDFEADNHYSTIVLNCTVTETSAPRKKIVCHAHVSNMLSKMLWKYRFKCLNRKYNHGCTGGINFEKIL